MYFFEGGGGVFILNNILGLKQCLEIIFWRYKTISRCAWFQGEGVEPPNSRMSKLGKKTENQIYQKFCKRSDHRN
jgi:hypothetical protein